MATKNEPNVIQINPTNNMALYDIWRDVPADAKKPIKGGRLKGMTDINPVWRIQMLTEVFGPCGIGWWYEITDKRIEIDNVTKQSAAFVDILLYYKWNGETSHGIPGTGGAALLKQEDKGPYFSDECFKMAMTDAISVAAKALGIGANVYFAAGRSKYTGVPEPEPKEEPKPKGPKPPKAFRCKKCGKEIQAYTSIVDGTTITPAQHVGGSMRRFGEILCLDCINAKADAMKAANEGPCAEEFNE